MPLRHSTETALLLLLALAIALTGLLTATLPPIPAGGLPWLLSMIIAIAYPVVLTPLFRARRADSPFRTMHWYPAFMLVLWFVCEVLALYFPAAQVLQRYFTVAWTLPAVALGIVALGLYCLSVIRRRVPRIAVLLLLLVPYAALGIFSARGAYYEGEIAALLWKGDWWQVFGSGAAIPSARWSLAGKGKSLADIEASGDASEERWREKMRAAERRSSREAGRKSEKSEGKTASVAPKASSRSSAPLWSQTSSTPAALPSSGGALEVIALSMLALYSGVLHDRMRKRVS